MKTIKELEDKRESGKGLLWEEVGRLEALKDVLKLIDEMVDNPHNWGEGADLLINLKSKIQGENGFKVIK